MVKHVNGQELNELIQNSDKTVVCDFWAPWCGPCRMLAPVLDELSEAYQDDAIFVKVNVDENEEAAVQNSISSIPNVIAFKGGKAVANCLGFVPKAVLENFVKENL
ncbi:MAG: thioredoxin [Clostridia bacterium]|nr:thioredoxin [Clostridia bacterium]